MKYRSIYIIALALGMMAFSSCKKELLKENTNPVTVGADKYNPNFLLSTVQLALTGSGDFGADNWQTEWGGVAGFIQHVASTNTAYYYGDKYLYSPGNEGAAFDHAYTEQVQPLVELFEITLNKPEQANLHRMAEIMRALVFQRLTDTYGDVPYFQAGLGYYDRIYTPVYDKQQDIYMDMLKQVSGATDSLDESETADKPSGDMYFSSNATTQIAEWKKFGYSLMVRLAMRISKVDPSTAQTYLKKALGKTMTDNSDNVIVQHPLGTQFQNRDAWSILQEDSADLKLCNTFIQSMQVNNDPRLTIVSWVYPTKSRKAEDQIGLPPGYVQGGLDSNLNIALQKKYPFPALGFTGYSSLSNNILKLTSPTLVLTYGETELLLADADSRWPGILGDPTSANAHYMAGVKASIMQYTAYPGVTVSGADADNYLSAHVLSADSALQQINTEYWKCTLMDEYEAWANWRRTSIKANTLQNGASGYPSLVPTNYKGNSSNGTIPRRMQYPSDQSFSNLSNYQAAVARLTGGDTYMARMWWDTDTQH